MIYAYDLDLQYLTTCWNNSDTYIDKLDSVYLFSVLQSVDT